MRVWRLLCVALMAPATLSAWTASSEQRIADKAARLAPPDLSRVIELYRAQYLEGLAGARCDGMMLHHAKSRRGQQPLKPLIEKSVHEAIAGMRGRPDLRGLVGRLGAIAHLVADANNPFHVEDRDPRLASSHHDFEAYLERRMTVFPTVFYGLDPDFRLSPYLDAALARSAHFYPLLGEEYFRGGARRTSADFDDRSTAFGVASVSYSRAVTDLVNVFYYVWEQSGGDVRMKPVMQKSNLLLTDAPARPPGPPMLGRTGGE